MNKRTVAIIGAGRVGGSIGYLLARAGFVITALAARSRESAERAQTFVGSGAATTDVVNAASGSEIIFITTPDRTIRSISEQLAAGGALRCGTIVVHMSGAHSLELLDAVTQCGAHRAVIHPLQSLASMEQGIKNLPGSSFRIEADREAENAARELVKALGGVELVMPGWIPGKHSAMLYHAGAVAVSNFFVALIDYGLTFYRTLGADKKEALKAVLPLIRGTLTNIETVGIPDALTGPIVRGDTQTVREHIEAMERMAPGLIGLYKELARQTISVARDRGSLPEETIQELLAVIND